MLYQLEDRWLELIGREPAGLVGVPKEAKWAAAAAADVAAAEAAAAVGAAAGVGAVYGRTSSCGSNIGGGGGGGGGGVGSGCSGGNGGSGGSGGGKSQGIHVLLPWFLLTLARDWVAIRELSCNVALCRQFWWFKVCLWVEDMPQHSLVGPRCMFKHIEASVESAWF